MFHTFDGALDYECCIALPEAYEYEIAEVYSDSEVQVVLKEHELTYRPEENWKAVAVYMKRK